MLASTADNDIAMMAIAMPMLVGIVWIIAHQWRRIRVAAYNARLKQLMIERGMSASDIERVLKADGSPVAGKRPHGHGAVGIGCAQDTDCCTVDADVRGG